MKEYLTSLTGQVKALAPSIGDSYLTARLRRRRLHGRRFDVHGLRHGEEGSARGRRWYAEGAIGWADTAFVTATSPNPQNAFALVNHFMDPEFNAAANSELLQGPGVAASVPLLTPEAKALYPYNDIDNYLSNTLTFNRGWPHEPDGDRATYDQVIATWEEVKGS